jgi:hypothetical protein
MEARTLELVFGALSLTVWLNNCFNVVYHLLCISKNKFIQYEI